MVLEPNHHDFQAHWQARARATPSGNLSSYAISSAGATATKLASGSGIFYDLSAELMSFPGDLDSESAAGKGYNRLLE
jgi:hypothetical protein